MDTTDLQDPVFKMLLNNVLLNVKHNRKSISQAIDEQRMLFSGDEDNMRRLEKVEKHLEQRKNQIEHLGKPVTLRGKRDSPSWYIGPQEDDKYWPALKSYLVDDKHWDEDTVGSINDSSSKVIGSLDFPGSSEFSTKGLVLG